MPPLALVRPVLSDSSVSYSVDSSQVRNIPYSTNLPGDLLILMVSHRAAQYPVTPDGWTLYQQGTGSNKSISVYYLKPASPLSGSLAVDMTATASDTLTMLTIQQGTYDTVDPLEGWVGQFGSLSTASIPAPVATATENSSLAVTLAGQMATILTGPGFTSPPAGWTQVATGVGTQGTNGWITGSAVIAQEAGPTPAGSWASTVTNQTTAATFIIRPAASVVDPPVAGFTVTPNRGVAPLLVTVLYQGTGNVTDAVYEWGDGSPDSVGEANPSHTYLTAATYQLKQTLTGPGGSATVTHPVEVSPFVGPPVSVGEEPSQLFVTVDGVYLDPFRVVLPLTHIFGRSDPGLQPLAPSVSFGWLGPLTFNYGEDPVSLTIGSLVSMEYDQGQGGIWHDIWEDDWSEPLPAGTQEVPRTVIFTGRITDLKADTDGVLLQTNVTAVGLSAGAGSFPVGFRAFPQETEAARINRAIGVTPYQIVNDANVDWLLIPRDPLIRNLLEALQSVAQSTGAFVWEDGRGRIHYQGSLGRTGGNVTTPLLETEVVLPVSWGQTSGNLFNRILVTWGVPPTAPAVPSFVELVGPTYGPLGYQDLFLDTELATEEDAQLYAELVLQHWGKAYWDTPQILIDMSLLGAAKWARIVQSSINDFLEIQGVTAQPAGPPGGAGLWLVEGWVMTYDRSDAGDLIHERQYGVSDPGRWGAIQQDTTTTATATPASGPLGTTFTVTATVLDIDGLAVPSGQVEIYDGVARLASGALSAGVAVIPAVPVSTGTRTLVASFVGTTLNAASEGTVRVEVLPVTSVSVAIATNKSTLKAGVDTATLTATISPSAAPGSVEWSYNNGSGWTVWTGHNSNVVAGKATTTWSPSTSSATSYQWRAKYLPSSPDWVSATSSAITIDVQFKVSKTLTYGTTSSATYQQDGDKRSDTTDCYQGYYSGTNGNQRSYALMPSISGDWSGFTITKVEARVTTPHWNSAAGGTLVLGSSSTTTLPANDPGGTSNRTQKAMDRGETLWIDISSWGNVFATGSARALMFGPGPSTSSAYYGYAEGAGTDEPQIRITGYDYQ